MGFIKCILCKIDHCVINIIGNFFVNSVFDTARHTCRNLFACCLCLLYLAFITVYKDIPLLFHDGYLFLAHGTAYIVTASHRISAKVTDYLHDLLLVYDTAVCR